MSRRNIAKDIKDGLREAISDLEGQDGARRSYVFFAPDVKKIRQELGLSQAQFAETYNLSKRTLQDWEAKRRKPDIAAANYLRVIDQYPKQVAKAIAST